MENSILTNIKLENNTKFSDEDLISIEEDLNELFLTKTFELIKTKNGKFSDADILYLSSIVDELKNKNDYCDWLEFNDWTTKIIQLQKKYFV